MRQTARTSGKWTHLNKASLRLTFFLTAGAFIFSSNVADPKGRDFRSLQIKYRRDGAWSALLTTTRSIGFRCFAQRQEVGVRFESAWPEAGAKQHLHRGLG